MSTTLPAPAAPTARDRLRRAAGARTEGRARGGVRAALAYRPFLVLLGAALALRVATMALYFPAIMESFDSPRFARVDPSGLFSDYWMPAGYAAFLKLVHLLSAQVWVAIVAQHLIGLGIGVIVFLTVRRLGAAAWLATVCAAVPLLSGDVLYLEHILMADQFVLLFAAAAIGAAARGLVPAVDRRWLAAAGALVLCTALSRSVGLVLLGSVGVCILLAGVGRRARLLDLAAFGAGAGAVFGLYLAAFAIAGGAYLGFSDMKGWNLYARAAPFADCAKFTPPRGTRALCDPRPPSLRPGPFGFVWDPSSVALRRFGPEVPAKGGPLYAFAKAAIVHQPGAYARAVVTDLARYAEPQIEAGRAYSGQPAALVSFGFRDPNVERIVTRALARRYDGTKVSAPGRKLLNDYQDLFRLGGLWLVLALLAAAAGVIRARGPLRLGAALFGLSALGLYVLPTLTLSYDFRYGIPPGILLVIAGALGAAGVVEQRRARRLA